MKNALGRQRITIRRFPLGEADTVEPEKIVSRRHPQISVRGLCYRVDATTKKALSGSP
jgi:hypothetical protein